MSQSAHYERWQLSLSRWLENEYRIDPRSLSVYRIAFAFLLTRYFFDRDWIPRLNDHLYHPAPGLMQLFDGFPSWPAYHAMMWIGSVAIACIAIGFRPGIASFVIAPIAIVMDGFEYSVEKVHHHILIVTAPLFFAATPWASHFRLDPWARPATERYWPFCFLALFIGAIFLSSALLKLAGGWLDLDTQAARAHLVSREISGFNRGVLSGYAASLGNAFFWEIADWLTVVFEAAIIFTIARRRYFRFTLAALCIFHLVMRLALNPNFGDYVIVYAAFFDWWALAAWWKARSLQARKRWMLLALPLATLGVWSLRQSGIKGVVLYLGAALGFIYLVVQLSNWLVLQYGRASSLPDSGGTSP